MNRHTNLLKPLAKLGVALSLLSLLIVPAAVAAATTSVSTPTLTTVQQQHLALIISRGDQEISRRLGQLSKLGGLITSASHITSTDKTALTTEVNAETSGLTTLKTQLDGETTLTAAITDAQSIFSDYRVYALVTPKIWLIKTADDQQVVEVKLTTLAMKLKSRLASAQTSGKNVDSLQASLTDLNLQVNNAQTISVAIETKVVPLQPSDYNSDQTILSGDYAQLKTAHADNLAAYNDAKTIVSGL